MLISLIVAAPILALALGVRSLWRIGAAVPVRNDDFAIA